MAIMADSDSFLEFNSLIIQKPTARAAATAAATARDGYIVEKINLNAA